MDDESKRNKKKEKRAKDEESRDEIVLDEKVEPDIPIEEHIILKIQNPELLEKVRAMVARNDIPEEIKLIFRDNRHATFHDGPISYPAKLYDLPCIIEAQKTFDNKQFYKISDICQVLVVDPPTNLGSKKSEESQWPHGLCPPLYNVRKRRFRKRMSKNAIDLVEREVARLLEADAEAHRMTYEVVLDTGDAGSPPDESVADSAEDNLFDDLDGFTADLMNSMMDTSRTPPSDERLEGLEEEEEIVEVRLDEEDEEDEDDGSGKEESMDEEEDEEGSEHESQGGIEEVATPEEEDEEKQLLRNEIANLEDTIEEKTQQREAQMNPIMKSRFDGELQRLVKELEKKKNHLSELL